MNDSKTQKIILTLIDGMVDIHPDSQYENVQIEVRDYSVWDEAYEKDELGEFYRIILED